MPSTSPESPTTNGKAAHARRWPKRVIIALGACLLAYALIWCCTFAFMPYGTYASAVWYAYHTTDEPIDTVYLGSSFAAQDLDPFAFDEVLGSHSFNLGSLGQPIDCSLMSLEAAVEDHQVDRVVLAISLETFTNDYWVNGAVVTALGKCYGEPFPQQARDYLRLVFDKGFFGNTHSLALLMPWLTEYTQLTPSQAIANIQDKLTLTPKETFDRDMTVYHPYKGRGYYGSVEYPEDIDNFVYDITSTVRDRQSLLEENLQVYERMCAYCEEQGVSLYVVFVPRDPSVLLAYGDRYPQSVGTLQDIAARHGATFLDFGMALPQTYQMRPDELRDYQHLTEHGASRFSALLAGLVSQVEAGQDVSRQFFSLDEWESWKAGVDGVRLVSIDDVDVKGGQVLVGANAVCAPHETAEYEFWITDADGQARLARAWSQDGTCTIDVDGHGTLEVRVNARAAGDEEGVHTYARPVVY